MNMNKTIIAIVLAILAIGCVEAPTGQVVQEEPIKIGASLFLTNNDFSYFAEAMQQGMQLAEEEINSQGGILGKKLTIVYEDDQLDGKRAVTVAQKLVESDKVTVGLTGLINTVKAAAPVYNENGVPVIMLWDAKIPGVGLDNLPYLFSIGFSTIDAGEIMAQHAYNKGIRKVAIIYHPDEWSTIISRAFSDKFKALGGEVVLDEQIDITETDFKTVILKSKDAEAIYAPLIANMDVFLKRARELDYKGTLLSGDIVSGEVINNAGGAAEGLLFTQIYEPESKQMEHLKELYRAKYSKDSDLIGFVSMGYDGVHLAKHAMEKAGSAESEAIKTALYATQDFEGALGPIKIDSFGGSTKLERVFVVKNGQMVLVE